MRRAPWKGLVALVVVAGTTSSARADFNIATGLKWTPLRYSNQVAASGTSVPSIGADTWQATSLDPYFAFFFTDQIGVSLALDVGYGSFHGQNSTTPGPENIQSVNVCELKSQPCDTSYFQFGVAIGGKFYLNRPTAQRVSPYLYLDFYKYFAVVSSSDSSAADASKEKLDTYRAAGLASLYSPLGFNAAFGVEYFLTPSFSVGAEVLGVRFAHVGGEWTADAAGSHDSYSLNYVTLYTGISLNYRFLATASVRTYEEEEEERQPARPKRHPARRATPPPVDDQGEPLPASPDPGP